MNFTELVEHAAERAGVSRSEARAVLQAAADASFDALVAGDTATLGSLGTLRATERSGRVLRGIHDGKRVWVGPTRSVVVRPSAGLRRALNQAMDQTWRDPAFQAAHRLAETLLQDLELYHGVPDLPGVEAVDVDRVCSERFGATWQEVRDTFTRRTPAAYAGVLMDAVAARWAPR